MKKYCIVLSLSIFCFACGGNETKSVEAAKDTVQSATSYMDNPDYVKGQGLVAKSDCFTCHKLREASTGPAYSAVAAKYESTESNLNMLADKIIAGGTGNWGQIPMAAHPQVSKEDAIAMVKFILLIPKEVKK